MEIAVEDTTVKQIAPKPDSAVKLAFVAASAAVAAVDGLNLGEAFSVAVSDLVERMAPGSTVVLLGDLVRPVGADVGDDHRGHGR